MFKLFHDILRQMLETFKYFKPYVVLNDGRKEVKEKGERGSTWKPF